MKLIMLLNFIAGVALAENTPQITDEQQIAYFQNLAEIAELKLAVIAAEKRQAEINAGLLRTCTTVIFDAKQRPVCQPPSNPESLKPKTK